MYKEVYKADVH